MVALPYVYLLRVVILATVLLLPIPCLALRWAVPLLGNVLDLDASRLGFVSLAAWLTVWSIAVIAWLIMINGHVSALTPLDGSGQAGVVDPADPGIQFRRGHKRDFLKLLLGLGTSVGALLLGSAWLCSSST